MTVNSDILLICLKEKFLIILKLYLENSRKFDNHLKNKFRKVKKKL